MSNKTLLYKEYAYDEDQNKRPYMEDGHIFYENVQLPNSDKLNCQQSLFGIFDGHGGKETMEYLLKNFKDDFVEIYKKYYENNKQDENFDKEPMFKELFNNIDNDLLDSNNEKSNGNVEVYFSSGSTAVVQFLTQENGKTVLYTANVGDSRSVITEEKLAYRISYDHKGSDQVEQKYIIDNNFIVEDNRVAGLLLVSRAFGDLNIKNQGVRVDPYVRRLEIQPWHKYLIVASDGIWDKIYEKDITYNYIKDVQTTDQIALNLLQTAKNLQSLDNISIIVMKLH